MLMPRIIPCLDVKGGRVVKGVQFQNLRDAGDPVACAARYEQEGADELVILDVSATPEGRANAADTVAAVRAVLSIPLTVGGGVRTLEDAQRLLEAGADKVSVNTAAVARPDLVAELASRFGTQCTVVAIDAASTPSSDGHRSWEVVTHSGTTRPGRSAIDWARKVQDGGAGEILLTSWDRDGAQSGYDLDLIQAVSLAMSIPVIASGGASSAADMRAALDAGADAVLCASILHDGRTTVQALKTDLSALGVEVRAC
jgi:imidazoleglycerol phosphate synthase cyclase subunit